MGIPMLVMKLLRQRDIAIRKFHASPTTRTIVQRRMPNRSGPRRRTTPSSEPGSGTAVPARRTNMRRRSGGDGIFLLIRRRSRLREEGRLTDCGAAPRLANLAQDEKHILLAGQGSEHRAFRQRLELLRGYPEALDKFMVASNLIEDLAHFLARASADLADRVSSHAFFTLTTA